MKTMGVLVVGVALLLARMAGAQAYKPKAEDFRIVDGVLYNTELSQKWANIAPGHTLVVVDVLATGVVMQEQWTEYRYGSPRVSYSTRIGANSGSGPAFRPIIGSTERVGADFFIKNYPFKVVNGDRLPSWVAMRAGETNWGGKVIRVFDCGLANTEENRKTLKR